MKKKILVLIAIVLMMFSSCGKSDNELEKKNITSFLTNYFTWNYDERYTNLLENQDSDSYYSCISEYITEDLKKTMITNRMPLKHDKEAYETKSSSKVKEITLTSNKNNTYDYKVNLELIQNGESKSQEITGQITMDEKSTPMLIENFIEK